MYRRWMVGLGMFLCLALSSAPVLADDDSEKRKKWGYAGWDKGFKFESADKKNTLKISNRVQFRFTHLDPEGGDAEGAFRVRRYKFKMTGHVFSDWKYKLQVGFASGSVIAENDSLLEDAWLQYSKHRWFQPRLGQTKLFFARQALTSSGSLQFVDRALGLAQGEIQRQIGVTLIGNDKAKRFGYAVGIYDGEGVNRTDNPGGDYLFVGRVVWTPFGEYELSESSVDWSDTSKLALGIKAESNTRQATTTTQLIAPPGGGPVTSVEVPDEPETDVTIYGFEYAYKRKGFNTVGEYFRAMEEPLGGTEVEIDAWYVQLGYLFAKKYGVAVRAAERSLDAIGPSEDRSELGVAFSWYISKHDYKLQADYRRLEFDALPDDDDTFDELRIQFQLSF